MPVSAPKELVDIATIINAPDHKLRAVVNALCTRDLELRGRVAKGLGVVAKREEIVLAKLRLYDAQQAPPAKMPVVRTLFPALSSSKSDRKPVTPPRSKAQRQRKSEGAALAAESKPLKRIKSEPEVKPVVKPSTWDRQRQWARCKVTTLSR